VATLTQGDVIDEIDLPCQSNFCQCATLLPTPAFGLSGEEAQVAGAADQPQADWEDVDTLSDLDALPQRERLIRVMEKAGWVQAKGAPHDLNERTEQLIAEEEDRVALALAPHRPRLSGKRVLLYTGGVKSWSIVSALDELGMVVIATSVRKSTEEDKERIRDILGEDAMLPGQIPAKKGGRGRYPDLGRANPVRGA
jgi:hypothetical protein